ncbi:MAG: thiosulfohydrolase SoxB [Betaproteobacteria bacterium]|nr:thiosulfohydrolase SoxB [Betaproteobacteria bacterium]
MTRRAFLEVLAVAGMAGLSGFARAESLYARPRFGNVHLLHITDCHAQLLPIYYRESSLNIGVGNAKGKPPHLVGEAFARHFGLAKNSRELHAFTHLNFTEAANVFGKVGGFAHLATLVKQLRADRPNALLLDGGDTWQGSATALWTQGQDMVDACKLLGVDVMTGHWEFTLGAARVNHIIEHDFAGHTDFLAQNVHTRDFADPVFPSHAVKELNGVPVAIIGQAFPHTAIANPAHLVPDWSFGLHENKLQDLVDSVRGQGARAVVLLSHNGMDVDLKLASRVSGIDAILGGHTHDGIPSPVLVKNRSGQTLVTNAGSNGKFLGVLDFDARQGRVKDFRYALLPVYANLLPADPAMRDLIEKSRAPFHAKLTRKLAVTEGLLYRRGNFGGTFDQLLLNALMEVKGAQIALSPGFRWGTSLLPGDAVTVEDVFNQTAITYPATTLTDMKGGQIKDILEDVCDNLFNPDPYYQQGGDMVRVGGMTYTCTPNAKMGARIGDMRIGGRPIEADRVYKVAGWAPVSEGVTGEPMWDLLQTYLRAHPNIEPLTPQVPKLVGVEENPGAG